MWVWECVLYVTLGLVSQVLGFMHRCVVRLLCSVETMQAEHRATSEALKLYRAQPASATRFSLHTTWVLRRQVQETVLLGLCLLATSWLVVVRNIISTVGSSTGAITNHSHNQSQQQQHAPGTPPTNQQQLCVFEQQIAELRWERERLIGQLEEARQQRMEAVTEAQQQYASVRSQCTLLSHALDGKEREIDEMQDRIAQSEKSAEAQRQELNQQITQLREQLATQQQLLQVHASTALFTPYHNMITPRMQNGGGEEGTENTQHVQRNTPSGAEAVMDMGTYLRGAGLVPGMCGRESMNVFASGSYPGAGHQSHLFRRATAPSLGGDVDRRSFGKPAKQTFVTALNIAPYPPAASTPVNDHFDPGEISPD